MRKTKNLVLASLCLALALALPLAFHSIANAGQIFLPMHLPVLLCGLLCGWPYGLACGALAPLLSSLLTGMPPAAMLPGMVFELMTYGFVTGFVSRRLKMENRIAHIYTSLLCAMLCGRAVAGVLNALIFRVGEYSLNIWLSASFITALPGIAAQLLLLPPIVFALEKSGVIPAAALTSHGA